jgi:hypothetical protein
MIRDEHTNTFRSMLCYSLFNQGRQVLFGKFVVGNYLYKILDKT